MNLKQSFSLALKSLMGSKMRSFLTMLGIIIGVAAVIVLMSIMNGFTNMVLEEFESMGTNIISVNIRGRGGNRTVTPEQMQEIADENSDVISYISPTVSVNNTTIKYKSDSDTTSCIGVSESYKDIRLLELENGRFLEYVDIERRQKSCVVGSYIASNFFDGENPLGQQIKIGGNNFTIVGILAETAGSEDDSGDDIVYIPYTLARSLSWNSVVSNYTISAVTKEDVDAAASLYEALLLKTYSSSDYYSIIKQSEIMEIVDEMVGTLTSVLVGIAAISLLVGGIGIMNIMLVSVTERTREIGIRKSLGARRIDIMSQFVVEAATTSSIGGVLGIVLGFIGAFIMGRMLNLNATPTIVSILVSFGVSTFIGVIFGYFPASKAAKLNPIDALRYD